MRALGKSGRRRFDFYETSAAAVLELRKRVSISGLVCEPCNGHGAISRCFLDCRVLTNDFDLDKAADTHLPAEQLCVPAEATIVSNPPFNSAFRILEHFHKRGHAIAFLLRLTFAEPTFERCRWLVQNPPSGMIVLPRHSFTADGKTDSVTCAWFVWGQGKLRMEPAIQIANKEG